MKLSESTKESQLLNCLEQPKTLQSLFFDVFLDLALNFRVFSAYEKEQRWQEKVRDV